MGVYYSQYLIPRNNTVRPEPDRIVALIDAWVEKGFVVCAGSNATHHQQESNHRTLEMGARFLTKQSPGESLGQATEPKRGFWERLIWSEPPKVRRKDPWMPFSVPPVGESLAALTKPYTLIRWLENSSAAYPLQTITEPISQLEFRSPHSLIVELSDDFINPHTAPLDGDATQMSAICNCGCNLGYEATGYLAGEFIRRVCPTCGLSFRPQDQIAEIRDGANGNKFPEPGGLCNRFGIIIDFGKDLPLYVPDSNGQLTGEPKVTGAFMETCSTALGIELNEFGYYS